MTTMDDWAPPLRPRPFRHPLSHPSSRISTSISLEDAALSVASCRPGPTPTISSATVRIRSVTNAPRFYSVESATFSASTASDTYSPYTNVLSRMRLFSKDGGGAPAIDGNSTPKKGQTQGQTRDTTVNSNTKVDARKVLSPEAIFCDSPNPSSGDILSLSIVSSQSDRTMRPNKLKTKRSFAKLFDITRSSQPVNRDSSSSSCDSDAFSLLLPPAPPSDRSSTTSFQDEDEDDSSDEEEDYVFDPLKRSGNLLHHRFPIEVAPYMQAYSDVALNNDYYSYDLCQRLCPSGSPSFHDYGNKPPLAILDLGCGEGDWAAGAATTWKEEGSKVTAFDLVDLGSAARKSLDPEVAKNVSWVYGNFVTHSLPFKDNTFDLVRMANLTLAIPRSRWLDLFTDIRRVLKPNGRLELIDDQITFAIQPPFTPSDYKDYRRKFSHLVDTYDVASREQKSAPLSPKEVWIKYERKRRMAETMEGIFGKMLSDKYDIALHPHEFFLEMLSKVFGPRNAEMTKTYQVSIPVGKTGGDGLPKRSTESEGSSKLGGYFDRFGKDLKNRQLSKDSNPTPMIISAPTSNPGLYSSPSGSEKTLIMNKKAMQMLVGDAPDTGRTLPAYQPNGLLIYPSTFLELDPDVVEMHACRSVHILLACKLAMEAYVQELNESYGGRLLEDEEFDRMLWDYDCSKRFRMNWPHPYSQMLVKGALSFTQRLLRAARRESEKEKASSKPSGGRRSQSVGGIPPLEGGVKPVDGDYVPVRYIRVFEVVKV